MKYILYLSACSFLYLGLNACKSNEQKPQNVNKETFVLSDTMLKSTSTAVATLQPVRNELSFFGKITADNNNFVEIYPIVGGIVTKVYANLGDYVKKGQLLATIRSTQVASFEKDRSDAKNDVIMAKNALKVAEDLYSGKLNTEQEVLQAKSELKKAEAQLNRADEAFNVYSIKGSTYEVKAPMSGFITQKVINQDMLLRSDNSDNIFDISEISDVWAIANVNETDINLVKPNMDAQVYTLSYPDKVFKGKVNKIFNIIDPETKAMKVMVKLNNPDFLLKPEMRAKINISYQETTDSADQKIAIPSKAIIFDNGKNYVVLFKDRNNLQIRPIEIYRQLGETTYISSGLSANEKVMTTNQLLVYGALNE